MYETKFLKSSTSKFVFIYAILIQGNLKRELSTCRLQTKLPLFITVILTELFIVKKVFIKVL